MSCELQELLWGQRPQDPGGVRVDLDIDSVPELVLERTSRTVAHQTRLRLHPPPGSFARLQYKYPAREPRGRGRARHLAYVLCAALPSRHLIALSSDLRAAYETQFSDFFSRAPRSYWLRT